MGEDPLFNLFDTYFCGRPCAQTWADLWLWERLLNRDSYKGIIEIGTWQGGFSTYLSLQTTIRGMDFITFDSIVPDLPPAEFRRCDVFIEHAYVEAVIESYSPVVLFCDGGNKPREAKMFAPFLGPEDLLVVHDWGTEFLETDIPDCVEPYMLEVTESLPSMSRLFKKKGGADATEVPG